MPKPCLFYLMPLIALICTANSCKTRDGSTWFVIKDRENRNVFHLNDTLHLEISGSKSGQSADSATWTIDGKPAGSGLRLSLPAGKLGLGGKQVVASIWHREKEYETTAEPVILSDTEPRSLSYEVLASYRHDTSAYTQGLFFSKGALYESTGRKGESDIRLTDINGRIRKQIELDKDIFGEGACLLNGKVYQLSWKAQKGFIYNTSLEKTGEFSYPFDGWGLGTDGEHLLLSDGTHRIRFLDPQDSMKVVRTIQVFDNKQAVKKLNELEYVDGIIYANVYTENFIVGIDPETGKVLERIDLGGLLPKEAHYPGFNESNYVLNGIAHDPSSGHFYLTGKKWPLLFEVRFTDRGLTGR